MDKTLSKFRFYNVMSLDNRARFITSITVLAFWFFFVGLLFLGGSFIVPLVPRAFHSFNFGIVGTVAALVTTWFFVRKEGITFQKLGLVWERKTSLRFLQGMLLGSGIFMLMIGVLMLFTDLRFHANTMTWTPAAIVAYLAIFPLAFMEELAFRSYSLIRLNGAFSILITQVITAFAFAVYHMVGGQSVFTSLLGPGVWAFVFGLAALRSGGIAMPTGIHVAINLLQDLAGMKGKEHALLRFEYSSVPTPAMIRNTEVLGIMIHTAMLIIAVLLTIRYQRQLTNDRQKKVFA